MIREFTKYSDVPWYRRSSFNTAFILGGIITKGYLPLVLVTCILAITGEIYFKEKDDHGNLKKWSEANKIAALVLLLLNLGYLLCVVTVSVAK